MPFLVRKVDKALWIKNPPITSIENCPSDAITICIKTKGNKLSVWRIESLALIDEAVLAIASSMDHLESIDVVAIPNEELNELEIINSPGITIVPDLVNKHCDLTAITYSKLGVIASCILAKANGESIKRYTKKNLKEILKKAVSDNRLALNDLKDSVRDNLD